MTDGDRGSLEAYLESVGRLLAEQDQELERCVTSRACGVLSGDG